MIACWLLGDCVAEAVRPRAKNLPSEKRGALAWERAERGHRPEHDQVLRLLVHGVNDKTNSEYIKEVRIFLEKVLHERIPFNTTAMKDWALAREVDNMCYSRQEPFGKANKLIHGFLHCFPEHRGEQLPTALRALRCWERHGVSREGGPASREAIYCIAADLVAHSRWCEAIAVLVSLDGYLREQDWAGLRGEDIYVADHKAGTDVALMFGRAHRGESVKTGRDQGVALEDELMIAIFAAIRRSVRDNDKIFTFSQDAFRAAWWASLKRLNLEWIGPPHCLRHSGPSFDATRGRRSLEDIRRRGRWSQIKSCQRYAKPHALTMHYSRLPQGLKEEGRHLMSTFHVLLAKHIPSEHPWSPELQAALSGLRRRRG